jgi:hypothetical protein
MFHFLSNQIRGGQPISATIWIKKFQWGQSFEQKCSNHGTFIANIHFSLSVWVRQKLFISDIKDPGWPNMARRLLAAIMAAP